MGLGGEKESTTSVVVSGNAWDATVLAPEDAFIGKMGKSGWFLSFEFTCSFLTRSCYFCWRRRHLSSSDIEAFRKDIDDLGKKLAANQGPEDTKHLEKIINWRFFVVVVVYQRVLSVHLTSSPSLSCPFAQQPLLLLVRCVHVLDLHQPRVHLPHEVWLVTTVSLVQDLLSWTSTHTHLFFFWSFSMRRFRHLKTDDRFASS